MSAPYPDTITEEQIKAVEENFDKCATRAGVTGYKTTDIPLLAKGTLWAALAGDPQIQGKYFDSKPITEIIPDITEDQYGKLLNDVYEIYESLE